jgi:hypothetical protein
VGRYGLVVRGEIDFLLARASKDDTARDGSALARAVSAVALAEAYGVEQRTDVRARIRPTLAKLVPVIVSARSTGKQTDPRMIGWLSLALAACRDIGLDVPDDGTGAAGSGVELLRPPGPPVALEALIKAQSPDGSWPPATSTAADASGRAYATATSVLALATPYKLLPLLAR